MYNTHQSNRLYLSIMVGFFPSRVYRLEECTHTHQLLCTIQRGRIAKELEDHLPRRVMTLLIVTVWLLPRTCLHLVIVQLHMLLREIHHHRHAPFGPDSPSQEEGSSRRREGRGGGRGGGDEAESWGWRGGIERSIAGTALDPCSSSKDSQSDLNLCSKVHHE